ncbi:MAG: hypothetical protein IJ627_00545 [Bacteroidales bacterium]|nr:hypothetical protein [Bacteroidales bacterium]
MKKVYTFVAVVAMMAAAVACECNNSKKVEEAPAEEPATEVVEEAPVQDAIEEGAEAVKDAATEKAVEVVNAAAEKAVEAIQN